MKNSNVAINPLVNETLTAFCLKNKLEKKQFIEESLKYFNANGINPAKYESPSAEIEKMHKRIEDIFKFSKAQERDVLKPFFIEIVRMLTENHSDVKKWVNAIAGGMKTNTESLTKQHSDEVSNLKAQISDLKRVNENISKTMAEHNTLVQESLKAIMEYQNKGAFDKLNFFSAKK
jgi:hypothetical protein